MFWLRRAGIFCVLCLQLIGLSRWDFAQEPTSPEQTPPLATEQKPASQPEPKSPPKITPEQAEQLFRDVDTILDFASRDTALPKKHDVKRRLASREEVVAYLKKNMAEDKDV